MVGKDFNNLKINPILIAKLFFILDDFVKKLRVEKDDLEITKIK